MKTVVKPDLKQKTSCIGKKSYVRLIEKDISQFDFKFYQKLFLLLISFSTILIFPDSPKELENICERHNSRSICNVW